MCISWCADLMTLRNARCNGKDNSHYIYNNNNDRDQALAGFTAKVCEFSGRSNNTATAPSPPQGSASLLTDSRTQVSDSQH